MSAQAAITLPSSRPKIHRLPAPSPRRPFLPSHSVWYVRIGVVLLASAITVFMLSQLAKIAVWEQGAGAKKPSGLAIADAMANPPAEASPAAGTIVITGQNGTIVGQMAKIPAQDEHITEIKPISEVDNQAGRELLSIINKY